MKYRVERWLVKDNAFGLQDYFTDLESAEAVAKAISKAHKTMTRIIFEGNIIREYDHGTKPKKK